jgi:peroxiredoxin
MMPFKSILEAHEAAKTLNVPLNEQLRKFSQWHRELSPVMAKAYDRLIGQLTAIQSGEGAPKVGDQMPVFILPDTACKLVNLEDLLKSGPVVVSFNRGHWCPFCGLEYNKLIHLKEVFGKYNARIVSIVPDRPHYSQKLQSEKGVWFPVLTDIDNGYALMLGLTIWVGNEIINLYRERNLDLPKFQGNEGWFLPIPATFVVGSDGIVIARFIDANFRKRMEVDELIRALKTTSTIDS